MSFDPPKKKLQNQTDTYSKGSSLIFPSELVYIQRASRLHFYILVRNTDWSLPILLYYIYQENLLKYQELPQTDKKLAWNNTYYVSYPSLMPVKTPKRDTTVVKIIIWPKIAQTWPKVAKSGQN